MNLLKKLFHKVDSDLVDREEFDAHLEEEESKREQLKTRLKALEVEVDNMSGGEYSRRSKRRA